MSSSVHLPDDVITLQILVKVPCVKSVLRCTAVCKSWYSFIKSPLFTTNLHLYGAKHTKYLLCDYNSNETHYVRYLSVQCDTEAFVEHYRLVFPGKLRFNDMTIHGSCNGLICYTRLGNIHLWNPTIRKLRVLPKFPNYRDSPNFHYDFSYEDSFSLGYGFWFDKPMNDYMVAVISYRKRASFVDIYSLSSNSWRIVSHSIPGMRATRDFGSQQDLELEHVAGTLHWPAERSKSYMIYSLDIKTGMFRETLLPLPWGSGNKKMDINLTAFGERSLAVFGSKLQDAYTWTWRCFTILVYDQNLNKLYTIDLEKDTCHVLGPMVGLRNKGEALFPKLHLDDSGIVSCNIETKDFEEYVSEIDYDVRVVKRNDREYQRQLQSVRPFMETLVLLNLNDRHALNVSTPRYDETDFKEDQVRDIKTGMFRETLLPLPWGSGNKKMDINLTAFGERSLAVFGSKLQDAYTWTWRCFTILVYDQNLNKLYTIDLEKDTCHVLGPMVGLRNKGEALFPKLHLDDSGIASCNIETKDFEEYVSEIDYDVRVVKRNDREYQRQLQSVRPFMETLVLLNLNDRHALNLSTPRYDETDFKEDQVRGRLYQYL